MRRNSDSRRFLVFAVFMVIGVLLAVWLFVSGIEEVVNGFQRSPVDSGAIAWGAVKAVFCEAPIVGAFALGMLFGIIDW